MTEQEWLTSNDPGVVLRLMTAGPHPVSPGARASDRQLRLFACAAWRVRASRFDRQSEISQNKIAEYGELMADGLELPPHRPFPHLGGPGDEFLPLTPNAGMAARRMADTLSEKEAVAQAALLKDIFNPFRPVTVNPAWLTWHDGIVVKLAQAAYQERSGRKCERCEGSRWISPGVRCPDCHGTGTISDGTLDAGRLGVIADALEEAGCSNEEEKCPMCGGKPRGVRSPKGGWITCPLCWGHLRIGNLLLAHLRSPGPHVRGCWVVDLLLGLS